MHLCTRTQIHTHAHYYTIAHIIHIQLCRLDHALTHSCSLFFSLYPSPLSVKSMHTRHMHTHAHAHAQSYTLYNYTGLTRSLLQS